MPAGQAEGEASGAVSAWMSPMPWFVPVLVVGVGAPLVSPGVGSAGAKAECGCCACPQLDKHALNAAETRERCRALTCLHSYGASDEASSELCATHEPRVCVFAGFSEKFAVRGCTSSKSRILRHRW